MGESVTEGRHCLQGRIGVLSDWVRLSETKQSFYLVVVHCLLHFQEVRVQILDVVCICKDEGLLWVKAESNDIFDVTKGHLSHLLIGKLGSVKELLIIRHLNHYWHIKCFLQILAENEGNSVSKMQCLS